MQSGHDVLLEIVSFGAGDEDQPLEPVVISRYGLTMHQNTTELTAV